MGQQVRRVESLFDILNVTFRAPLSSPVPDELYGTISTFARTCFVLLLRVGFILIQVGSIPTEDVYLILLQNIVDISICITSYTIVGYIFAFGKNSFQGFIAYGKWFEFPTSELDNIMWGLSACIIATGIMTTLWAGRLHFVGYCLHSILFSMFFHPIVMNWVWNKDGWLHYHVFVEHDVSIKDHGGGIVIHVTAGIAGFIGVLFLGRRVLRLSEIDEASLGPESPGTTIMGYFLIAAGLISFTLPTTYYTLNHQPDNYIGVVLLNNFMGLAGGILMLVVLQILFQRESFNYWIILRCMQGGIAGIVAVSTGADVYSPIIAFAIVLTTSVLFYFVLICLSRTSIEDYCNIVPTHLIGGSVGAILPPFLARSENLGYSVNSHIQVIHTGWQLIGLAAVVAFIMSVYILFFLILWSTGFMRNKTEAINHQRAVSIARRGPRRCFLQRLFAVTSETVHIEPGNMGKTPQEYEPYNPATAVSGYGKQKPIPKKEVTQVYNAEIKFESSFAKKLKSLYTLTTAETPYREPKKCVVESGDIVNEKAEEVQEQQEEKPEEPLENRASCYELHRTKKCIDLLQRKKLRKKGKRFQSFNDISVPRSSECVRYDRNYSDGFITLKLPDNGDISFYRID